MTQEPDELISYLRSVVTAVKGLQNLAVHRNKTTKIKAVVSMLTLIEARADATLKYARTGSYSDISVFIQKEIYDPIIEWLAKEIST